MKEIVNSIKGRYKYSPEDKIIALVEDYFGITLELMCYTSRKREIVYPRQVAMYLLIHYSPLSLKNIGKIFGKDHTTVIHSRQSIQDLIDTNSEIRNQIGNLTLQLNIYGKRGSEIIVDRDTTYPGHA